MASLNEDETSGSENGKQDENANESKNQDFSFQIGGTWVIFFNFNIQLDKTSSLDHSQKICYQNYHRSALRQIIQNRPANQTSAWNRPQKLSPDL